MTLPEHPPLKHVVLALDSRDDVKKYLGGADDDVITVVLARKYRVEAAYTLTREQLTEAKIAQILQEVATKLATGR